MIVLIGKNTVISGDLVVGNKNVVGPTVGLAKINVVFVLEIIADRLLLVRSH